jgi:hypothetical protein
MSTPSIIPGRELEEDLLTPLVQLREEMDLAGRFGVSVLAWFKSGLQCRLSLRERKSFRGAKGDNNRITAHVTRESRNLNHASVFPSSSD